MRTISHTPNTDAVKKAKPKKRTAQFKAQARPKVRPLVLEGVLIHREATDPLEGHALRRVDPRQ
jgi:hypothetical protein